MALPLRTTDGGGIAVTGTLQGKGLRVTEGGAAATMGTATTVGGTGAVTVNTTAVTANSRIFLTTYGAATGFPRVSARVANTSFTIQNSVNEAVTVAWLIVEPGVAGV